jgi:hypothetical protein
VDLVKGKKLTLQRDAVHIVFETGLTFHLAMWLGTEVLRE